MSRDPSTLLLSLLDYDRWATERLLAAAGRLTPAELIAIGENRTDWSVRSGAVHVIDAMHLWLSRMQGRPPSVFDPAAFPDVAAIGRAARDTQKEFRAFVAGLTESELDGQYDAQHERLIRRDTVLHVLVHGMHHRGELAERLTALGASPGDLDYGNFLASRSQHPA